MKGLVARTTDTVADARGRDELANEARVAAEELAVRACGGPCSQHRKQGAERISGGNGSGRAGCTWRPRTRLVGAVGAVAVVVVDAGKVDGAVAAQAGELAVLGRVRSELWGENAGRERKGRVRAG